MSDSLQIELSPQARAVMARVREWPASAVARMARALDAENELTIGHITTTKLRNAAPQFLNARTGHLRHSLRAAATRVMGAQIETAIGTNVGYAAVHEFGSKAYTIRPRNRRALRFAAGGKKIFAYTVRHPGHRARAPIRTGIRERANHYAAALSEAVVESGGFE